MSTARAWLGAVGAVAAGTAALVVLYGLDTVGVSAQYDLLWGAQLAAGERVELDAPFAPTPHPLTVGLGAAIAILGGTGGAAMALAQLAGLAVMALAVWLFASELFDRRVATLAVVLLALCPLAVVASFDGVKGSLWIAGLAWAGRAELRTPRAGAPVLWVLAVLGLVRPEAWALAALYCGWLWLDPARRRAVHVAAVLAPPALWMAFEWAATGDPLSSFHTTREMRGVLERDTGLVAGLTSMPGLVRGALGGALPGVGLLGAVLALAGGHRRVAGVLAGTAILAAGFVAQSALGFSVIPNYLLPVDVVLVVLAAAAVLAPLHVRIPGRRGAVLGAAALSAVAVAVAAPGQLHDQRMAHDGLRAAGAAWVDLRAVVSQRDADATCGPVDLRGAYAWRPLLALHLDRRAGTLRDGTITAAGAGLHVVPVDGWVRGAVTDPPFDVHPPDPPPGAQLVRRNASWAVWELCA